MNPHRKYIGSLLIAAGDRPRGGFMRVLFLYVSTNMSRDGELWFYDEGLASTVTDLRSRGHESAFRMVGPHDGMDDLASWIEAERGSGVAV